MVCMNMNKCCALSPPFPLFLFRGLAMTKFAVVPPRVQFVGVNLDAEERPGGDTGKLTSPDFNIILSPKSHQLSFEPISDLQTISPWRPSPS